MDITLPALSWQHGVDGNIVTWAMPEHTEASPYVVLFKRRPHNGDTYGYQIKVVRSHVDAVTSVRKNQIIEVNFRNLDFQTQVDAEAAFAVLQGIIADVDLKDKVINTGQLPTA